MSARAPLVGESTREERLAWVRERYVCISNCDLCGICASFHRRSPEDALASYIEGEKEHREAMRDLRR